MSLSFLSFIMVQSTERLVSTDAERYLLIYMITVLVIVTGLIILFFVVFQKRKNKILLDKLAQERRFEKEITQVQTEIQEETLKNISRELHDNVGQLLSFANMQLNLVTTMTSDVAIDKIEDTKNVVKEAIQQVRGLSKSLNNDVISNVGLLASIQNEIHRLNKLGKIKGEVKVEGNEVEINPKDSIILFRTFQEFLSNTIKYSEADDLKVYLKYTDKVLEFTVEDNGIGFDKEKAEKGSGLINMKNRAALIQTEFSLETKPKEGVKMVLIYPLDRSSTQTT